VLVFEQPASQVELDTSKEYVKREDSGQFSAKGK
jgi:hypothetical protein